MLDEADLVKSILSHIKSSISFEVDKEGLEKIISSNYHQLPKEISGDVPPEAERAIAGINASFVSGFKTA
jgi:hypothetical protein